MHIRRENRDNAWHVFMLCLFLHLSQDCAKSSYICLKIKPQGCWNQRLDFLEMHWSSTCYLGSQGGGGGRYVSWPPGLCWGLPVPYLRLFTLPVFLDPCTLRLAFEHVPSLPKGPSVRPFPIYCRCLHYQDESWVSEGERIRAHPSHPSPSPPSTEPTLYSN